jgi:cell division septal protein FtsQ
MEKNNKRVGGNRRARSQGRLVWLLLAGGLMMLVFVFLTWRNASDPPAEILVTGAPHLVVDQELVDFGDVPYNQLVHASFKITNAGDQALRFTQRPTIRVVEGC